MSAQIRSIPLRDMQGEVNKDVIENLENLLGWARLGAIQSLAVVAEKNGALEYSTANVKDRWKLLGYLSHLQYKVNGNE